MKTPLNYLIRELLFPLRPALVPAGPWPQMLRFAQQDDKETVEVQRRRRPTSSGDRERADAPEREREKETAAPPPRPPQGTGGGGGGHYPPSGGGGGGGQLPPSGGYQPSGGFRPPGGCMGIGAIAVIAVLGLGAFLLFSLLGGGGQQPGFVSQGPAANPVQLAPAARPTDTPRPLFAPPAAVPAKDRAGEQAEWLVMLYQDADDKILEQDIYIDANEAERAGSGEQVHVVTQIDRYQGGFGGDGDWTGTKRFYITPDADLGRVGSVEVADLGEVNMADGKTLVDFVTWAVETYPAQKHVLILSDHGMGWPGGWTDPTARASGGGSPMEQRMGDQLFLNELDAALTEIRRQTGIEKFELIGLDACLMAHIEVFSALEPHARYAVASQETEPAVGWAYAAFLAGLADRPNVDAAELGRNIVASYIEQDQRIQDDKARAEMTGAGRGLFGAPSADQLARQLEQNVTISAVDLSALPELMNSLNTLAHALQSENPKAVAQARTYSQSYTSVFGRNVPPSYIDIGNFTQLLDGSVRDEAAQALGRVQNALEEAVVAEKHGPGKKGSNGISIYFPNSDLYRNPIAGYPSYTAIADRFAQGSLWDEFLTYHYTGRSFDAAAAGVAAPAEAEAVSAPAAGQIRVSPIEASQRIVVPGDTVRLSVDIAGEHIGYIKLLVGYYDPDSNAIAVIDSDYLESPDTQEVDGVYYPVWPEDEFTMAFEWEPIVFAVDDGKARAEAVFNPEDYGESFEDALYSVDGIYTYADDGESRSAIMYFRNGEMTQVFGFSGEDDAGAPREILPQAGDTFTVYEQWLELDNQGRVSNVVYETGDTVTFSAQPITWETLDAAAGEYVVGFIIEDLDGEQYPATTEIRVR